MSDTDNPTFSPPRPATPIQPNAPLPSRAEAPRPEPMWEEPPKRKPRTKKAAPRKAETLSAKEIRSLNAKRAQAKRRARERAEKASPVKRAQRVATVMPSGAANRPLEAKTQLQAVLELTGVLRKPELVAFTAMMQQLAGLTRGARRKVLEALGRVYP